MTWPSGIIRDRTWRRRSPVQALAAGRGSARPAPEDGKNDFPENTPGARLEEQAVPVARLQGLVRGVLPRTQVVVVDGFRAVQANKRK